MSCEFWKVCLVPGVVENAAAELIREYKQESRGVRHPKETQVNVGYCVEQHLQCKVGTRYIGEHTTHWNKVAFSPL